MFEIEEINLDGHVDDKGIRYIGKARRQENGKYWSLAIVGDCLCRVEITLTPIMKKDQ